MTVKYTIPRKFKGFGQQSRLKKVVRFNFEGKIWRLIELLDRVHKGRVE